MVISSIFLHQWWEGGVGEEVDVVVSTQILVRIRTRTRTRRRIVGVVLLPLLEIIPVEPVCLSEENEGLLLVSSG